MRVVIMGGGQVGEQLARVLTQDTLDVVLIEQNEERARILEDRIDAQIVMGSGISAQLPMPICLFLRLVMMKPIWWRHRLQKN